MSMKRVTDLSLPCEFKCEEVNQLQSVLRQEEECPGGENKENKEKEKVKWICLQINDIEEE